MVVFIVMGLLSGCGRPLWRNWSTLIAPPDGGVATVGSCVVQGGLNCTSREITAASSDDYVVLVSSQFEDLVPGALLAYESLQAGSPRAISIRRAPIVLRLDLPIENASVVVSNPTVEHLKQGVNELLIRAAGYYKHSNYDHARFRFQYQYASAASASEALHALRINSTFNFGTVNGALGFGVEEKSNRRHASTIAKLEQVLFTISVTTDQWSSTENQLAWDVSESEVRTALEQAQLSSVNPPVLVNAVAYGRFGLVRVLTDSEGEAKSLAANLSVGAPSFAMDAGLNIFRGSSLNTNNLKVVFNGGQASTSENLMNAILDGGTAGLLAVPQVESVAPVGFSTVFAFSPYRPAGVLSVERFTTTECVPPGLDKVSRVVDATVREGSQLVDTGVDLVATDAIEIAATGKIFTGWLGGRCNGPDGDGDADPSAPIPNTASSKSRANALIGRAGGGSWIHLGDGAGVGIADFQSTGRLYLRTNDNQPGNGNECQTSGFSVKIKVTSHQPAYCGVQ